MSNVTVDIGPFDPSVANPAGIEAAITGTLCAACGRLIHCVPTGNGRQGEEGVFLNLTVDKGDWNSKDCRVRAKYRLRPEP
jgi:hypothetical protein